MESKERGQPSEMDEFIPHDKQVTVDLINDTTKVTIRPAQKKDYYDEDKSTLYDPFKLRCLSNPTSDCDTLAHLLKSCLGTGILAMPFAFKNSGVLSGVILTIIVAIICSHCAYVLVKCAHKLYRVARVTSLTYPDIGEVAFAKGPKATRILAKPARICIIVGIFLTYFGTCCAYNGIIAANLQQVFENHHIGTKDDMQYFIAALLIPLLLLSYVPNLKSLAICSQIANVLMGSTIAITMYYVFFDSKPIKNPGDLPQYGPLTDLPVFFSIVIFAMECIGVIMPLENNMAKPKHLLGTCGVMNIGMTTVTLVYILVGFVGYLKYADEIEPVITLNLPKTEIASQCAKVFIAFAVFFTYGLQFYVCLDIVWGAFKDNFKHNATLYNYILRTILVVLSVVIAIAVPQISALMSIVGALFFSALGLLFPVLIEIVVFWEDGFGFAYWKLFKNIFILIFGTLSLIFGTHSGVMDVINYKPK